MRSRPRWMVAMLAIAALVTTAAQRHDTTAVLKGAAALGDWRTDQPGVGRLLTPQDLPTPMLRVSGELPRDGEYEDFTTGFVVSDQEVWGRPVRIAVAKDGSLIVTEDGNGTIWRVSPQASSR